MGCTRRRGRQRAIARSGFRNRIVNLRGRSTDYRIVRTLGEGVYVVAARGGAGTVAERAVGG